MKKGTVTAPSTKNDENAEALEVLVPSLGKTI